MELRRSFPLGSSIGPYRLLQKAGHEQAESEIIPQGEGATSLVFLVEQKLAGGQPIKRALKLFSPNSDLKERRHAQEVSYGQETFLQEIEAMSSITHQNIVSVIDSGYHADGRPFFVMEFIDGDTLEDILKCPQASSE